VAVSIEAKENYLEHLFYRYTTTTALSPQCSLFGKKLGKARVKMAIAKHTHTHPFPNRPSLHAAVRLEEP
jgi:hypothetical protein